MTLARQRNPAARFSKPAYETLVSWINEKNNRGFSLEQFNFTGVIPIKGDGTARVSFNFDPSTGWQQGTQTLVVQRVDISNVPGLHGLVVHSPEFTKSSILTSIFEQYGLYLDMDLVDITPDKMPLPKVILNKYLDGFVESDDPKKSIYDNADISRNYIVHMRSEHPTLVGSIPLYVRKSLKDLIGFISPTLSLREYYIDGREDLPFVDTLQPKGLWTVSRELYPNQYNFKEVMNHLHTYKVDDVVTTDKALLDILTKLSKFNWTLNDEPIDFNLMDARVLYNGLTDPINNVAPIEYNYLLVLELSDMCTNLQGEIRLAYQYASPNHPMNRNRLGISNLGH